MKSKRTELFSLCAGLLSSLTIVTGCTAETKGPASPGSGTLAPEKKTPVEKAAFVPKGTHVCEVSGPVKDAGTLEIVTEQPVPVVEFAAKELQTILKQATGQDIPIVRKASEGKTSLILGDCPSARAVGIDVSKLPDEGFRISRQGGSVFIAGQDDPSQDPAKYGWSQAYRRATLSGVYDFLERFAGARFFFPGPYGTVIPEKKGLFLPEKIEVVESPDMALRSYYEGKPKSYMTDQKPTYERAVEWQRLRLSENPVNYGHGLMFLNLPERFGKTHPEYFALWNGKRYSDPKLQFPGQLCYNSGVREEIYQDAKAYFTGKPASSRGMKYWHKSVANGKYFCIMPQDSMHWCQCEECRKIATPENWLTPEGRQAISNFMFRFTSEIANRLTQDGIQCYVTQMVYLPYDAIPDCDIPKNVLLQVAVNGTDDSKPGPEGLDDRKSAEKLRAWHRKTGTRVTAWTYAMGKHGTKNIPGVPQMMPREAGKFLVAYRDALDGVFWESETDRSLFNYLNFYIVAKMMWNSSLDVEAVLDDHYKSMFGKGAPMVKEVFDELEKCWVRDIISNMVWDDLGPRVQVPSDREIWTKIFSPEKLTRFEKLFDQARSAAAADKGAVERLKFIREQILGPLLEAQKKFQATQDSVDSWRVYCPGTVYLRPYKGEVNEVNTRVDIAKEDDALVFRFDCEEPRMADLTAKYTGRDVRQNYSDSAVEIFINPSGDRKHYYHFVVNANGALTDYRRELNKKPDIGWNSSAAARTEKGADGWKAEVRIPLADLGTLADAVPVNFARHRALEGQPAVKEIYYQWSPQPGARIGGFHALEKWGTLSFEKAPEQLIPDGDFSRLETALKSCREWRRPWPKNGQIARFDNRVFMSGGQSLYYKNVSGELLSAGFKLPGIKPKTQYSLSFYIRTQEIKGNRENSGVGLYFSFPGGKGNCGFPMPRLVGTHPWHRLSFEFTTPDQIDMSQIDTKGIPCIGLWAWFVEGEVWFDKIELVELGPAPAGK